MKGNQLALLAGGVMWFTAKIPVSMMYMSFTSKNVQKYG
jgi:hypothetical protein